MSQVITVPTAASTILFTPTAFIARYLDRPIQTILTQMMIPVVLLGTHELPSELAAATEAGKREGWMMST